LQEKVRWRDFVKVLSQSLNLPIPQFDSLKSLFLSVFTATKPENSLSEELSVDLESFSNILNWFGPFFLLERSAKILADVSAAN
jgi:hypothetical protein